MDTVNRSPINLRLKFQQQCQTMVDANVELNVNDSLMGEKDSNVEYSLSSADLAWVDSCLVQEPMPPTAEEPTSFTENFSSLRNSLPELTDSEQEKPISNDDRGKAVAVEESESMQSFESEDDYYCTDADGDGYESNEEAVDGPELRDYQVVLRKPKGKRRFRNAFKPNYCDDYVIVEGDVDSNSGMGLATSEIYGLSDDIFKVWDLGAGFTAEENEFMKEMNNVIINAQDDSSLGQQALNDDVDSLISSIANLTLKKH